MTAFKHEEKKVCLPAASGMQCSG